jgi:hypothetical protein
MSDAASLARPRAWRLQFSLRILLLAFTAFAIGFPIWYRWPYEEIVVNAAAKAEQTTTWQRQWGGARLKHGVQRQLVDGKTIESLVYRNGLRHGLYESGWARGEFVNDLKEGVWTGPDRTMTFRDGRLHGPYELLLPPAKPPRLPKTFSKQDLLTKEPRRIQMMFSGGRLTQFNGQPAASRLFDRMEEGSMDQRTRNELDKFTNMDVVEMPLKDCCEYLSQLHGIPITVDPCVLQGKAPGPDMPITDLYQGIDLCSALTLMTAPRGLGCDYRYGCLWITTAEDCNDWRDPTGIVDIKPPSGSPLARAWNELLSADLAKWPLPDAIALIDERMAVFIDASRARGAHQPPTPIKPGASAGPFTPPTTARGSPLRHVLGQLLYNTGCRCQLDGETLVILPPEEK